MTNTADTYLRKAQRTLSAARTLLQGGDTEGACNRAYYAMYNAAHAILLASSANTPDGGYKTHGGLIGAFGKYVVLSGKANAALGRALNEVQRLRQIADYVGDPPTPRDATWAVEQAATFVAAMRSIIDPGP